MDDVTILSLLLELALAVCFLNELELFRVNNIPILTILISQNEMTEFGSKMP